MCTWLNGTSGSWVLKTTASLPAGLANANNPDIYPAAGAQFDQAGTLILSKIELVTGGPIQILGGSMVYSQWGGGAVLHATDGRQAGLEYWLAHAPDQSGWATANRHTYFIDVFCPKTQMGVRMVSEDGYSASYTTTGPDQCIAFGALSKPATKRNYRINVLPGPNQANVIAVYFNATGSEKGWTAPFLQQGVHYEIVAPPIAFVGQSFWITIIVQMVGGGTEADYCGTTSFTSTDPGAKIESTAMDAFNFTWNSSITCPAGSNQNGVHIFMNVTFTQLGMQTIVASDTTDGSVNGLTALMIIGADVKLFKEPALTVAASGDTVRFKICWSNYSSGSAFTFTITDAVPRGMSFLPEASPAGFDCGNTDGVAVTTGYSTVTSATPPLPGSFTNANPIAGTQWLRWTFPYAGVQTTGCACFRATVN
jgi:uncharacterized repeat protein (TIGR01451 family)